MFALPGVTQCFDTAGREAVRLEEVDPKIRGPILQRYLQLAPGARAHIAVDPSAPLEEFKRVAAQHPVFLVRPDSARISD